MPRLPPATLYLLWIITGGYLLQMVVGAPLVDWFALWPLSTGTDGFGGLQSTPMFMPWQLLTYAALHGDSVHLFFNGLALWMFGAMIESTWGTRRFVQYALVCIAGAGLTQLVLGVLGLFPPGPTIGISGLTYGLLLAYGMLFPNQQVMLLIPPIPMKAKYLVMLFAGISLFMGITGTGGIAHFAHLGGMLFGWLMIRYWRGQPPFGRRRPRIVR